MPFVPDNPTSSGRFVPDTLSPVNTGPDISEKIAGNPFTRFAVGAASPFLGSLQLGANIGDKIAEKLGLEPTVGKAINDYLSQYQQMADKGSGGGFDVAGLGGQVLNPVGLGLSKALPVASGLLGKIGQGAAVGAGYGATMPVTSGSDYWGNKGLQTGAGAAVGGVVPAVTAPLKGVGNLIYSAGEPFFNKGRTAILDRYQQALANSEGPQLAGALENAKQLVPGSQPTSGEAMAALPSSVPLAAHQKLIASTREGAPLFQQRLEEQGAARQNALGSIAQTPATLETAQTSREAQATLDYATAFSQSIKADPQLAVLSKNPYFQDALPDAVKLARANKIDPKTNQTQFLHYVKLSLDKQLTKSGDTALSATEKNAVSDVKKQLVDWLSTANPAYETARSNFAANSAPINQMQVGQYLENKLLNPLTGAERPGALAQALRDAPGTIKRSTGANMYSNLSDILSPQQTQSAEGVVADLSRAAQFKARAAAANIPGGTTMAASSTEHLPNLLSRPAMLANYLMRQGGMSAEDQLNQMAAERYLNPQLLAKALRGTPPSQLQNLLRQLKYPLSVGAPTALMGGMSGQASP